MKKESFLLFLIFITYQINAQFWEVTEIGQLPEPISNNAVCEGFGGTTPYLYSFGGIDTTKNYTGINLNSYRVNSLTGIAETLPNLPDTLGKIAAGASRIKDTIYIIGGYHVFSNGSELSSDKVHRFNINTNTFMTDAQNIPVATDDHVQAVWRDSLIYVITGWSNTTNIPDVQIYNATTNIWLTGTSTPNNNDYKSFGASGTIVGDTIYYFGGASSGFGFGVQNQLRKGIINPSNPTDISWNFEILDPQIKGYRMACTTIDKQLHWIGGSDVTYNYDGIAYNGTGGVTPNNRDLYLDIDKDYVWNTNYTQEFPMDLRGIASINDSLKYIAGGMLENQVVTNKIYRMNWNYSLTKVIENTPLESLLIYPNPVKQGDKINVQTSSKAEYNQLLELINIEGKTLLKTFKNTIDTSILDKGVYVLKITSKSKIKTSQIIIY